jgi:predicted YcjX-like family ATPase
MMFYGPTRSLRVGVTGLARAGKTAFLTSVAANLLAQGAGLAVLPALSTRFAGRGFRATIAPSGAHATPRFDHRAHLISLASDPARWPERTAAVSLLSLDLEIQRTGLVSAFPPRRIRLEFLDYPGEWLLDLPLLSQDFYQWSEATLRRLETPEMAPIARDFLAFMRGLPQGAMADETLAATGHGLYRAAGRGGAGFPPARSVPDAGTWAGTTLDGLLSHVRTRCPGGTAGRTLRRLLSRGTR